MPRHTWSQRRPRAEPPEREMKLLTRTLFTITAMLALAAGARAEGPFITVASTDVDGAVGPVPVPAATLQVEDRHRPCAWWRSGPAKPSSSANAAMPTSCWSTTRRANRLSSQATSASNAMTSCTTTSSLVGPSSDFRRGRGQCRRDRRAQAHRGQKKRPFVSRGDDSGTDRLEKRLWKVASLDPASGGDTWYRDIGSGMGPALKHRGRHGRLYDLRPRQPGSVSKIARICASSWRATRDCSTSTA